MSALVVFGWAALVVVVAWRKRPAPARVRALAAAAAGSAAAAAPPGTAATRPMAATPGTDATPGTAATPGTDATPVGGLVLRVADRLGGWLLRRTTGRRWAMGAPGPPQAHLAARRLGLAVLIALAFLPVVPAAAVPAALVAWAAPAAVARRAQRRRLAAIASDLPDIVDLLVLGVGAGLTVHLAVERVARRATGPLADELRQVVDDVALGRRLADALDVLPSPRRAGEAARPLVGALLASERYGAPLAASLGRLADEVRRDRRRRAEEAARKIPVKLLFPLVTCTLPAFGLLTVAPLIASALRSLRL